jgi:predicted Kef-type K+ transport protein
LRRCTAVSQGDDKNPINFISRMYAVATLLAVIISVPAVTVAVVAHYVFHTDTIITLGASLVTFFVAMGFGIKLSKRFARAKGGA